MENFRDAIELLEDVVTRQLKSYLQARDLVGASNYCFNQIVELGNLPNARTEFDLNIQRYLYAIQMLQLQVEAKHLKQSEIDQIVRIAETSLQMAGVKEGSRRGYLFDELYNCKSNILQQTGRPLGAQWELLIGKRFLSTDIVWVNSAISETIAILNMGYAHQAKCGFEKLLDLNHDRETLVFLELQVIKAARLSGCHEDAHTWIDRIIHDATLDEKTKELIAWEAAWVEMAVSGSHDKFVKMVTSYKREFPDEPYLSLIYLLFHAHPAMQNLIKELPSIPTIRKRFAKKLSESDKLLFDILELFQNLYDSEIAMKARLSKVTELIDRVQALTPEYQLLFFLALARWAFRYKQKGFTQLALSRYQSLSYAMSDYQTDDVLNLIADMRQCGSSLWFMNENYDQRFKEPARSMSRLIGRRFQIWKGYARLSWKLLASNCSLQEKAAAIVQTVVRSSIEKSIVLTGPLAKQMQAFTHVGTTLLGIDESIGRDFSNLYNFTPAEKALDLLRIFEQEFGQRLSDVFSYWEELPFSGGSISQVFRATLKDGRQMAIKLKYPDIVEQAQRDYDMVKRWLVPLLRRFSKSTNQSFVDQLFQLFYHELDFKREVAMMQKFREIHQGDPDILIPAPELAYCSDNCITMDYLDGASYDHFLANSTQEERNQAGMIIFRYFLGPAFACNLFKADLFFGNCRFARGKVIFLDYGRIFSLAAERQKAYQDLMRNLVFDPDQVVLPIPEELGGIAPEIHDIINRYVMPHVYNSRVAPMVEDIAVLRDEILPIIARINAKVDKITIAEYGEAEGGMFALFMQIQMGSHANWRDELLKVMARYSPETLPESTRDAG